MAIKNYQLNLSVVWMDVCRCKPPSPFGSEPQVSYIQTFSILSDLANPGVERRFDYSKPLSYIADEE